MSSHAEGAEFPYEDFEDLEADGVEHQEILDEIETLQRRSTSWTGTILILLVSAGLFLAFGMASWSWAKMAVLVGVLLFHELGHLAAMWIFRYRNLKMFFIPFFGAAASGRNYNVAGWKKAVVTLAGPLPGIALGIVLGLIALFVDNKLMLNTALVAVVLNGFNLLPVLPLDGGWVMHALLFSRHPLFDAAFRSVTAIATAVFGLVARAPLFLFIGAAMLIGVPQAYRTARLALRLRDSGLISVSPDGQSIPVPSAQMIIDEMQHEFPGVTQNRAIAALVLQIFEAINSRPPGIFATLFLGAVYLAGLVTSVVFGALFFVAQTANLRDVFHQAVNQPRYSMNCGEIRSEQGAEYQPKASDDRIILVATFDSRSAASAAYEKLLPSFPADSQSLLFGQTTLLELAADEGLRKHWLAKLEPSDLFVDRKNYRAFLNISCVAPNEETARAIEEDINGYLMTMGQRGLVPPWSPDHKFTPEQRRARATFQKLRSQASSLNPDAHYLKLAHEANQARRRGDQDAADRLGKELAEYQETRTREAIDKIRAEGPERVDFEVIDLYLEQPKFDADVSKPEALQNFTKQQNEWLSRIAEPLGKLPTDESGQIAPADNRYSATSGWVTRAGLALQLGPIAFTDPVNGAPALAQWLCSRDCGPLKYQWSGSLDFDELLDADQRLDAPEDVEPAKPTEDPEDAE